MVLMEDCIAGGAKEQFIDIDGYRLRYLTGGSGPSLLLIHGLAGSSFCWRKNFTEFSKEHTVLAPDLLLWRGSARGRPVHSGIGAVARMLKEFLQKLNVSSVDVLGSSYGGAVAMLLSAALDARFKVRKLVLVAPVNPWSKGNPFLLSLFSSKLGGWIISSLGKIPSFPQRMALRRMYGNPSQVSDATLGGYVAPLKAPGIGQAIVGVLQDWKEEIPRLEQLLPKIASIPTLLIWGDRDRAILLSSAEKLQSKFGNAQLSVIPTAGHLVFEECPDEFNNIVLRFLERP